MLLKTILNQSEKFKSFVYDTVTFEMVDGHKALVIDMKARKDTRPICPTCMRKHSVHDTQKARLYEYIPILGFKLYFRYARRRANCNIHGPTAEHIPWAVGNAHQTTTYKVYLARWARRLSWKETAGIFKTSWDSVFRAVKFVVGYGLAHQRLEGIKQIGIDEISYGGHKYLTLVYQLDKGCRRLLWSGPERRVKTLIRFFWWFGKERSELLEYVSSDMWAPYMKVIKKKAVNALNILDRFHIMKKFNEAIDTIRREEAKQLSLHCKGHILIHSRWLRLKNKVNMTENQVVVLKDLRFVR
jgi:transposase